MNESFLLRFARLGFWAACVATLVGAVIPPTTPGLNFLPWDKAEHFVAFYALTAIAAFAFPRRSLAKLALLLCAFGGSIELVQALPLVHRDAEWGDWLADSVAIVSVLLPMALERWRVRIRR
jgi:hypothetical protein